MVLPRPDEGPLYQGLFLPHLYALIVSFVLTVCPCVCDHPCTKAHIEAKKGVIVDQLVNFVRPSPGKAPPRTFDKVIVALLAMCRAVTFALDVWSTHRMTYTFRNSPTYVYHWQRVDFASQLLIAMTTVIAQAWFIERAWKVLKKSYIFLAVVGPAWLLTLGAALAFFIVGMRTTGQTKYFWLRTQLLVTYAWSGSVVDLITTAVLCYRVRQAKAINRRSSAGDILVLAFTTGSLTSVTALAVGAIQHQYWNTSNAFAPFIYALAGFATISVLVTIGHRRTLQGRLLQLDGWSEGDNKLHGVFAVHGSQSRSGGGPSHLPGHLMTTTGGGGPGIVLSKTNISDEDIDYSLLARELARKKRMATRLGRPHQLHQAIDVGALNEWRAATAAMATGSGGNAVASMASSPDFELSSGRRPMHSRMVRRVASAHDLSTVREGSSLSSSQEKGQQAPEVKSFDLAMLESCAARVVVVAPRPPKPVHRGTSDQTGASSSEKTMVNGDDLSTSTDDSPKASPSIPFAARSALEEADANGSPTRVRSQEEIDLDRALASYMASVGPPSASSRRSPLMETRTGESVAALPDEDEPAGPGLSPRVIVVEPLSASTAARRLSPGPRPAVQARRLSGVIVSTEVTVEPEE